MNRERTASTGWLKQGASRTHDTGPKISKNPGLNKTVRANVPNSHTGLLLSTVARKFREIRFQEQKVPGQNSRNGKFQEWKIPEL